MSLQMPVALFTEWHAPDELGGAQSQTYMDTRSSSTVELANLTKCNQACNLNDILQKGF